MSTVAVFSDIFKHLAQFSSTVHSILAEHEKAVRAAEKDATKKKRKREGPKRPPSSYLLFAKEHRDRIRTETGKSMTEVSSVLGNMWKQLTESDRRPYDDRAYQLKEKYNQERHDLAADAAARLKAASAHIEEDESEHDDDDDESGDDDVSDDDDDDHSDDHAPKKRGKKSSSTAAKKKHRGH